MKILKFFRKLYHSAMRWITHSNGQKALHGTTVTGGKFAIAEGVTAQDLLGFAAQMEKTQNENPHGQPAPSARLDLEVRVPV